MCCVSPGRDYGVYYMPGKARWTAVGHTTNYGKVKSVTIRWCHWHATVEAVLRNHAQEHGNVVPGAVS